MFLQRLRDLNTRRCTEAFKHTPGDWSIMEWGCAAAGEMGELCNVLKKIQRQSQGISGSRILGDGKAEVAREAADVVIYLDLLLSQFDLLLEDAVRLKFNETSLKVNFPEIL